MAGPDEPDSVAYVCGPPAPVTEPESVAHAHGQPCLDGFWLSQHTRRLFTTVPFFFRGSSPQVNKQHAQHTTGDPTQAGGYIVGLGRWGRRRRS